jgi:hypothetical protein
MKQHITPEQFNELSDIAKDKLHKWFSAKGYYDQELNNGLLLSIGQMIELRSEEGSITAYKIGVDGDRINAINLEWSDKEELCDKLWHYTKHLFER